MLDPELLMSYNALSPLVCPKARRMFLAPQILAKNLADMAVGSIGFFLIGWALAVSSWVAELLLVAPCEAFRHAAFDCLCCC